MSILPKASYRFHEICIKIELFTEIEKKLKLICKNFPGGPVVKNLPTNVVDMGLVSDPRRSHMP